MGRRKRLLLVTNRFYPQVGGAEINIFLQAQELSKHFDVDVFTPMRDRNARQEEVGGVIRITRGFNFRNLSRTFPDLKSETLCPGVFFKTFLGRYDVVHCFPSLCRNTIMALIAATLKGIPIFVSIFDLDDYGVLMEDGLSLQQIFDRQAKSAAKVRVLFERFNSIFTISNRETASIKALNGNTFLSTVPIVLDEYEARTDPDDFKTRYGVQPSLPLIVCVGRVAKIKGQDILIRALPLLREKTQHFQVLIVGRTDYEPDYLRKMEEFIAEENLQDHVKFTGVVPRGDVIGALKACDVHVLPVRFMNSGAVVIETWAARRPVLHSDMIDPCYVVEGENGFTFKSEDPTDLCEKLFGMLQDKPLRESMGENGRRLVEQKFLYPHLIRQYIDAYEKYGGSKWRIK